MSGTVHVSLPPLESLSFLPFIVVQAGLLHPSFPDYISRPLRFALLFPAVYLAAVSPFRWRIEPVDQSIGANFRWGIFGPYFIMKAIEWGTARDRSPYVWIGFNNEIGPDEVEKVEAKAGDATETNAELVGEVGKPQAETGSTNADGSTKVFQEDIVNSHNPASQEVEKAAETEEKKDSAVAIFVGALHLLASMRGIGYAFGPPRKDQGPPAPVAELPFFLDALASLLRNHIVSTLSLVILVTRKTSLPQFLYTYFLPLPSLTPASLQPLANIIAYFFVGISLYSQLQLGQAGFCLLFQVTTKILRFVLPNSIRPPPFDPRQFPPLFDEPWNPVSITTFWSNQWHALFRKSFISVGYDPFRKVVGMVAGKSWGRIAGTVSVFALSSWMHDQALWSARYDLATPLPISHLSFVARHGGHIFFLSQAFAIILETAFVRTTGRKLEGGFWASLWCYCWIIGVGLLCGRSWISLGLVKDVPEVSSWGWQRWVIPSVALAPPGVFLRT